MTVQTIKLGKTQFVILPAKDYRDLERRANGGGTARRNKTTNARDRADIELARRRLADPNEKSIPYEQVRKELGLK